MIRAKFERKKIIIASRRPIYAKGWAHGPITNPYHEYVSTIKQLLRQGLDVYEELSVGNLLKLDETNYNTDNSEIENTAPVLSDITVVNVDASGNYELRYACDDKENDELTHSLAVDDEPSQIINPVKENNEFKVNAGGLTEGQHNINVEVNDGQLSDNKDVEVVVPKVTTPEEPIRHKNKNKQVNAQN